MSFGRFPFLFSTFDTLTTIEDTKGNGQLNSPIGIAASPDMGDLIINGGSVNATSAGFGIEGNTVTINGGTVEATGTDYGIYSGGDITISGGTVKEASGADYGIYAGGSVTISGNADVQNTDLISGAAVNIEGSAKLITGIGSIFGSNSVTISGGTVTAASISTSNSNSAIIISGGTVTATSIYTFNSNSAIIISGGTVTANGSNSVNYTTDDGATISGSIVSGGSITISGPQTQVTANAPASTASDDQTGIFAAGNIEILGGTVEATGNVYGIYSGGSITISEESGTTRVTATVSADVYLDGIYASGNIEIQGGTVEATGYIGIHSRSITIKGGEVTANANLVDGINAGSVTINGGTVNATGNNNGIHSRSITIKGGEVTAEGGNGGIYGTVNGSGNDSGGAITIDGGTVEATGSDYGINAETVIINKGTVTATATAPGIHDGSSPSTAIQGSSVSINGGDVTATGGERAISGSVKNAIPGIGWHDTTGTGIGEFIRRTTNQETQDLSGYNKVQFPAVKTPPTANNLTYNGSPQELVTAGETSEGTMQYAPGTCTAPTGNWSEYIPTGINAGLYDVCYRVIGSGDNNVSESDQIEVTIAPKSIDDAVVTLDPTLLTYNGSEQSVSAAKIDDLSVTADDFTVTGNTGTNAGGYTATVTGKGNFQGTATADWSIDQKPVTVTLSAEDRPYDPESTAVNLSGTVSGLVPGDEGAVTVAAAGTVESPDAGTAKPVTVTSVSLTGEKAGNYALPEQPAAVTVTITKAAITPVVEMNGYTYGDDPIPAPKLAEGGNPGGGTVTYYYSTSDSTGSGTKWENIAGTTLAVNTYYMYAEVSETDNYAGAVSAAAAFTVGRPGEAVVTITGKQDTVSYDGQEHSVSGYAVQINNTKYSEADFSFSGTAEAKQTDTGTAVMGLKEDMFTNLNGNFTKVTFIVEDGFQTVAPKAVTVRADDKSKKPGEPDPELTVTVEGTVGSDIVEYTTLSRAEGEEPGTYAITAAGETSQGNYSVSFVNGTFTILAKETAQIKTLPEGASGLTADGSMQDLLQTAGASDGGTVKYSVNGGDWSDAVPQASEAGEYLVSYYIEGSGTFADNGSPEKPLGTISVVIMRKSMELPAEISVVQGNGEKGVPDDVKAQTIRLTIRLKQNGEVKLSSAPIELAVTPGGNTKPAEVSGVTFTPNVPDFKETCGNYEYEVTVTPGEVKADIAGAGDDGPAYILRAAAGSPDCGKFVITLYWNSKGAAPVPEVIRVVALPEDEIGAYQLRADGTKEYLLFQTYDICIAYLGRDELCAGPERCYHK